MKKKIIRLLATVTIVMLAVAGCGQKETVVKDREGNDVTLPSKMDRIISTAPSNTEVLVELGLSDKLVAVDTYSTDIDGLNKDIPTIDFSNPDAEAIIGLEPDLVLASGHNKSGSAEDPLKLIKEAGIAVAYIPSSDSIEGVYEDTMFIADVVGESEKGTEIVENMKKEVAQIKKIGDTIKDKKSVYFEIGPAPNLYSFGNSTFLNEMIETVGAKNILADEKSWIAPSEESIIDKNPDVILTNVTYIDNPIDEIKGRKGWESITAIKENQVFPIDKNASSRPSQNIIIALKEIAQSVYPEQYGQK